MADPWLWACGGGGSQLLIWVLTHMRFQVWAPRALIELPAHPGTLGLFAQAANQVIMVCAHPGFQLWGLSHLIWVRANWASGVLGLLIWCSQSSG